MTRKYDTLRRPKEWLRSARACLPRPVRRFYRDNSYWLWYCAWLAFVALVFSAILFEGNDITGYKISYTDALYLCISAVGGVGLSPANLGDLSGFQQAVTFVAMLFGDATILHSVIIFLKLGRVLREKPLRRRPDGAVRDEERSLRFLGWHFLLHPFICMGISFLALTIFVHATGAANTIRYSNGGNLNPTWWCAYNVVSCYTNTGLDLMNKSLVPFQDNPFVLINSGIMVMVGKTYFPVLMYCEIWCAWRYRAWRSPGSEDEQAYRDILDRPRFYHPLLFSGTATFYLALGQVGYTGVALALWYGIQANHPGFWESMSAAQFAYVGFVQCTQLRAGGMQLVSLTDLPHALNYLFGFLMLFSLWPFQKAVQAAEDKLAKAQDTGKAPEDPTPESYHSQMRDYFTTKVIQETVVIGAAIGGVAWNMRYKSDEFWRIAFEVCSAWSGNGMSQGDSSVLYSFSGTWKVLSKWILMGVMIWGRVQNVPKKIDTDIHMQDWPLLEPPSENAVDESSEEETGAGADQDAAEDDEDVGETGQAGESIPLLDLNARGRRRPPGDRRWSF